MLKRLESEPKALRGAEAVMVRIGGRTLSLSAEPQRIGDLVSATFKEVARLVEALRIREREVEARTGELDAARERLKSERVEEQAALLRFSTRLLQAVNSQEVMALAVHTVAERFEAPRVTLRLLEETGRWLVLRAGVGWPQEMVSVDRAPLDGKAGISIHAVNTRSPVIVADCEAPGSILTREVIKPLAERFGVRSALAVPMVLGDRVIGTMSVNSREPGRFGPDEAHFLSLVASQVALALDRTGLFATTRQQLRELSLLHEVTVAAATARDLDGALFAIIRSLKSYLGYEHLWIMLREGNRLRLRAPGGPMANQILELAPGEGVTGWVAQTGDPLLVEDVLKEPRYRAGIPGTQSELCVPLKVDGQVLGVINVESPRPGAFSQEDVRVLSTVAQQVAAVIERARLLETTQRHLWELTALSDVSAALRGAATVEQMVPVVAAEAIRLVRADAGILGIIDHTRQRVLLLGASGATASIVGRDYDIGQGLTGHVIRTNSLYRTPDLAADPLTRPANREMLAGLGPAVCVPLRTVTGQVVGALTVARRRAAYGETPSFLPEEERLLLTLAEMAGNALQRVRTHEALEEAYMQTVLALANAMDARDTYTAGHSQRLADLTVAIAREMGCVEEEIQAIRWGALLHDIGKIAVPDAVLSKPGRLTEEEWAIIRRHPDEGARIVVPVKRLHPVIPIIRHHQEWWDGAGYPDGLKEEAIPLGARILAVVDAYVAMTDERVYRAARSHEEAIAELRRCAGTQFDPHIVPVLCRVLVRRTPQGPPDTC
ncbi:MAG: GAF domain-containing protein [Armatimonadetes bacterium]|nr:GAF domain-containing protein [Armatimonadota bacterium]